MKKLLLHIPLIVLVLLAALISPTSSVLIAGTTERISVDSTGNQLLSEGFSPSYHADRVRPAAP